MLADLRHADILSGKHLAEIYLLSPEADAATPVLRENRLLASLIQAQATMQGSVRQLQLNDRFSRTISVHVIEERSCMQWWIRRYG